MIDNFKRLHSDNLYGLNDLSNTDIKSGTIRCWVLATFPICALKHGTSYHEVHVNTIFANILVRAVNVWLFFHASKEKMKIHLQVDCFFPLNRF